MAYLLLEDGTLFEGETIGNSCDTQGELVFNTGMEGYQESLTDPAVAGQIITFTYPLIGNYGINDEDCESAKVQAGGVVVHELCEKPSNWMCKETLGAFLTRNGIPGIAGVDTRALTRKIRDHKGVLRAAILQKKPSKNYVFEKPAPLSVQTVTAKEAYTLPGTGKKAAVLDLGVTRSSLRYLSALGLDLTVLPADTSAADILSCGCEGVFLSSGPSDPAAETGLVNTVKQLIGKVPVFGIGMGCELIALACGGKTVRLPHGHRGANQPVKNIATDKMLVTNQNHGFTIEEKNLPERIAVTYRNWNDGSIEGIRIKDAEAFGVLFYPAKYAKAHDTFYLYEEFVKSMDKESK